MIKSFKSKETEKLFNRTPTRKIPRNLQRQVLRKLRMLNSAMELKDLQRPPGNHLESLTGNRRGQYSIRVNDQWRICFIWSEEEHAALEVEMVDYH
ncbi:MAG: type II toxin-antitoxin system RelE/ParE family toxin [Desulfarculus sp.]|jgi:proteic killer suppression protein|nr:MAG: type II toxin-antitoxin system RelE/ParE family toxin [Desulfarculus sp.]